MEASAPAPEPAKSSNRVVALILGSVLVVLLLGAVVYFATHESEEDQAMQAICASRADIQTRVAALASTTVANFSLDDFKANVQGISNDVATIRSNYPKARPDARAQLQQANQQFETAVTTTLKSLGTSLSLSNAKDKLKTAGQQLVTSYKDTLEPVDCSGVD